MMIPPYILRSKISLTITALSFTTMMGLGFYESSLLENVATLQGRLLSLKTLAVRSQEMASFLQTHREDFTAFEECQFDRPITPETLKTVFPYEITFGAASPVKGTPAHNRWVTQEVFFSVPCLRDRDIFMVLERLVRQGPGLFRIREIEISRVNFVTETVLQNVASGKPQVLFKGGITALWVHQ